MTICTQCGDSYPIPRHNLGYRTCLSCGDKQAHQIKWCTAPINKSNYVLISNPDDLRGLNPKRSEQ
jgi:hypothetical protein